jgi:putative sterol carrier protein
LRAQLTILKHFFDRLPIVNLRPDHSLVASAPGAMTQALTDGADQWIIYFESMSRKAFEIKLNLPKGSYKAQWTDVTTGQVFNTAPVIAGTITVPSTTSDKVVVISAAPDKK